MKPGHRVVLSAMDVEVASVGSDGRPSVARCTFTRPLESYSFVRWAHGKYEPVALPELGQRLTLPEEDFGRILLDAVLAL
jgi:hypothetical protein